MENPSWEVDAEMIWKNIDQHSKELDDLEYNYLGGQLAELEAKIKETKDQATKERLQTVKKQFAARMEDLRPAKKSGGLFGLLTGNGANGEQEALGY
jgi:predicted mannosyl-3-phosphoglycerate phosphatase (HAD superfamily)